MNTANNGSNPLQQVIDEISSLENSVKSIQASTKRGIRCDPKSVAGNELDSILLKIQTVKQEALELGTRLGEDNQKLKNELELKRDSLFFEVLRIVVKFCANSKFQGVLFYVTGYLLTHLKSVGLDVKEFLDSLDIDLSKLCDYFGLTDDEQISDDDLTE